MGSHLTNFNLVKSRILEYEDYRYNKQWFINWGSDEYYLISDKFWPKKRIAMEKQNEEILALLESAQVLLEQGRDSIKKGKLPMQIEIR